MADISPIVMLIRTVQNFSNNELISVLKEVDIGNEKELSSKADELFKFYYSDDWKVGIDRFDEITKVLHYEVIRRIKANEIKI